MIKRFHEAPKQIFDDVQYVTDGDYALVNLFAEDHEYYQLFEDAVAKGREVILDNGVFELGKAWNAEDFAGWVEQLRPTWYIVPDVLEDGEATIDSFFRFTNTYKGLHGKVIGVAQGKDYNDLVNCYKTIEPFCNMVAIGFDYSWFQDKLMTNSPEKNAMIGRRALLSRLEYEDIVNKNKPHHLLGVMLPQEVKFYHEARGWFDWIYSIDTSNPVVHGLKGIRYTEDGLGFKEKQKLYTMINASVSPRQLCDVLNNIEMFRRFCNG